MMIHEVKPLASRLAYKNGCLQGKDYTVVFGVRLYFLIGAMYICLFTQWHRAKLSASYELRNARDENQ